MATRTLKAELARKAADFETVAAGAGRQPELLQEVFTGLGADRARIKYGCLKVLRRISEKAPRVLYPHFEKLVSLLDSDNTFLKWGAIIIIGNLATVDAEQKIDRILDRYLQPIAGPVMITAGNVIGGAGKIALAKPYLADRIARAFLQVETATYQTAECRNVALGHAVQALDRFFEFLQDRKSVMAFVKRQLLNPRNAVRRKAAAFLSKRQPRS